MIMVLKYPVYYKISVHAWEEKQKNSFMQKFKQ